VPKPLVIVESPAKARTIAGFLGSDFVVESSIGHIRDLPRNAAEVPAAYKGEPWARDGVDCDNDFKPLYVVPKEKKDQVRKLKDALKDASELLLATDEDREGESISWHLIEVLNPRIPVKRMVFHEITRAAIQRAVDEWRELDMALVDAQETRRILDRLYGYRLSEVLWKKSSGRSAGRVQSVATRVLVERERARMRFRSASYWDIDGTFAKEGDGFDATLVALDNRRLATGKDFSERGEIERDVVVLDEAAAIALAERLRDADFAVRSVDEKPYKRSPAAPFMTSTLQQEAGRKLGYTAQRAMRVAQSLYENGYITYMRTDSTTLSDQALAAARSLAAQLYGDEYVPEKPRVYAKKVKNAQEAHEAIRPSGDTFRLPDEVAREVGTDEARLYELIWQRTVASQMADAVGRTVSVRLGAMSSGGENAEFATSGTVITFAGFQRVYVEGADEPEDDQRERRLPQLAPGDALACEALEAKGHSTQPPARFTEASLVKALEEMGVGRPSTYASIIGTIQDRGYVFKKGSALVPSWTAFAVVQLLEQYFAQFVDYGFTAQMEDDLDRIAGGEAERAPWLRHFYFGNGTPGLKHLVVQRLDEIDPVAVNSVPIGEMDGETLAVRVGKYGPYIQHGEARASVPEELPPDELTIEKARALLEAPSGDREIGVDPDTGKPVFARAGRYGPYVQLGEAEGTKSKPPTASLFKTMSLDTVTLDDALRLLTLPRVVGVDPSDSEEIVAANGRYGPYIKKGKETRSLEAEDQLFTVTLDEALAILAQPKQRRGQRAAAAAPLRELGENIVVKDGRFGPYVTDGETNASLRKDDAVEEITLQRAQELLADRRARGPATKPKRRTTKKAAS
jgi:DNA topoisomerase I